MTFAPLALHQWREVQEWLRLNKIYQGLRVKDDRPRYVFHGNISRHELEKRGRKTKALFPPLSGNLRNGIKIPGLKTLYRPIMGGSPATYYMRADGTAATYADATGPGSSQSDCMSIATHNAAGDVFLGDDVIRVCDDGGVYRVTGNGIYPQSDGSDGSPITYEPESGDSPIIYPSVLASGWALYDTYKYRMALSPSSYLNVFFSKSGTINFGIKETSIANLSAEYEWFHDGSTYLYCYSPDGDPDEAYDWVEAAAYHTGVRANKNHVTIDGLEVKFAGWYGIYSDPGKTNLIVKNCIVSWVGRKGSGMADGILMKGSNSTAQDNTISKIGTHGIYVVAGDSQTIQTILIEGNSIEDCHHTGIDLMNNNGTISDLIVSYNRVNFTSDYDQAYTANGVWVEGNAGYPIDNIEIYYNLVTNFVTGGIAIGEYSTDVEIYNNTVDTTLSGYSSWSSGIDLGDLPNTSIAILKNNICVGGESNCLNFQSANSNLVIDYNLWYKSSGTVITAAGDQSYTSAQFANYQTDYSPQDANSKCELPDFLSSSDYHLKTESPCINAGVSVGLEGSNDYDGRLIRPGDSIDMGCYQTLKGGPRRL